MAKANLVYDCPQMRFAITPRQIFRYAGLAVCLTATLPVVVRLFFVFPLKLEASIFAHVTPSPIALRALFIVSIALCLGFNAAFWWNTRDIGTARQSKTAFVLLVLQLIVGFRFTDCLYIVAVELPLMLPFHEARKWLAALCAVLIASAAMALATGNFEPMVSMPNSSLFISVPVTILYVLAWISLAFGAGYLAASETRSHQELARVNSELMATQSLLSDDTRLAERLRISRELHDVVGHHLAGLSINLQLASHMVEGRAAAPVREAHLVAKLLLAEVREVVGGLRDPRQTDLRKALELVKNGVIAPCIHLELPDELDRVDPVCAHVLFRCFQEAITNAIKHAGASNLWVELKQSEAGWEMHVRDDGRGAASISPGNGLRGMVERLEEVGGNLQFGSRPGEGFKLRACIPGTGRLA